MYLKSLELMGFKSFGKKTVFDFQPGITAIIGPNGSGKSNVCDAIRWVLGEQSAKALRGTKMSEVIFAGTPQLRPAAFSQVKLVLDNQDHLMPIDYSEVAIGRQLFRSGESHYFLNSSKALLSDIKEMLMDTGIGKEGYSIIGQGDIDDIVFQRIQNRRTLIEEAAGITKFKHRKHSTLQKLEHTRANITRLRDIVGEIELQLGPLAVQAEKTRQYQALAAEIRTLEIDLVLFDLTQLYGEHESVDSMRRGLLSKIAEIETFLAEIGSKKAAARERLAQTESTLREHQARHREITATIEAGRAKGAALREEIRSHEARCQAINEEIAAIETRLQDGGQEIADAETRLRDEEEAELGIHHRLAEIEANLGRVQAELDQHLKEVSQDRESSFQIAVQMADKKNRINTAVQQMQMITRQLEKGASDVASLEGGIATLVRDKERLEKEIKTLDAEIADGEKQLADDQNRLRTVERDLRKAEEELTAATDQIKIAQARRSILEELKNRAESGIARGVREVLALAGTDLPGIFGMVGDLIKVPRGYEIAFETALGASIQDVITRDAATAQAAIELLKQRKAGRATFLPLDLIQPPPRIDHPKVKGCLGVALDLVEYDARFYSIMNHLLGRILIFDSLDAAVAYARTNRNFNRLVTLDGDVVRSSGAMTGGAEGAKTGGLLARKRELEELEEKLAALVKSEKQLAGRLQKLAPERANLLESIRRREEHLVRRKQSVEFFRKNLEKQAADLAARQSEFAGLQADRRDLETELARLQQVQTEAQAELARLESQNQDLTARLQALSGKEAGIQARLAALRGLQHDEKLALAQVGERKKAIRKEIESAVRRRREAQERRERAAAEVTRLQEAIAEVNRQLAAHQATLQDLEIQKAGLEKTMEDLQNQYHAGAKELDTFDHTFQSRSKMLDNTRAKLGELDVKLAEIKTNISNKEGVLAGEFNFDITEARTALRKYESRDELTHRLAARKAEQEALEPVNLLAIEDYEKTKERYDFLNGQIKDMTDAAASLEQVIAEIEKISGERFMATFKQIDLAFQGIFPVLFPGGEGQLRLTNPDDVLNSGVDIVCRPPGKKLSTLELFSGGEKSMVAIALLFAILQVKPPAFCVLDEVEAALDEVNVKRFIRLLRSFADKTQFLVITHNKETMQAVDVIYGITLEKEGISRQISIRLEDQEKIKEFTVRKPVSAAARQRLAQVAAADAAAAALSGTAAVAGGGDAAAAADLPVSPEKVQ
ncbi:MAG: Chromosome partition protein smc [Candidatus Ozemobacter sibiricus]|uniref:Chromosome partition protein Smc n=1 Tax=Candidatus Ozemobacter sibiricus TaxID=2268124 RepID=A0A367ZS73_9BACT|nr:MAG: Chromosome partition protein smc [Candidatus Ozemobacter sibiricus]